MRKEIKSKKKGKTVKAVAMLLALALGLCSCGINDHLAETLPMEGLYQGDPMVDVPASLEDAGSDQEAEAPEGKTDEASADKANSPEVPQNSSTDSSNAVEETAQKDAAQDGPWSITVTPNTADYTAEDGVLIFSFRSDILTVYNSKDPDAAARVQQVVDKLSLQPEETLEMSKEMYDDSKKNNYEFYPNSSEQTYSMVQTNGYLSIIVDSYEYTGGAHGLPFEYCRVFGPDGSRLMLSDLFTDVEAAGAKISEEVERQIEEQKKEDPDNMFFDGYEEYLPQLLDDESATWYLSPDGLTVISNPYILAAYAAGTLTFTIPKDMDLGWKLQVYGK